MSQLEQTWSAPVDRRWWAVSVLGDVLPVRGVLASRRKRIYDIPFMTDVTQILNAIAQGDPNAASQLLPLVYDELRQLAAQKLAQERPGQTLQPTSLVHEAYLRLVDGDKAAH